MGSLQNQNTGSCGERARFSIIALLARNIRALLGWCALEHDTKANGRLRQAYGERPSSRAR